MKGASLIMTSHSVQDSADPCGRPRGRGEGSETDVLTLVEHVRSERKEQMKL